MSAVQLKVRGGARLKSYLDALRDATGRATGVRVGFLANADYPATPSRSSLHVAQVAFWNEFGTSRAPARPFFRGMIRAESPQWGAQLAKFLRAANFESTTALTALGTEIKDALTQAINEWPADNAPSTVKMKGFDHGLIRDAIMLRSVDFEVLR